MKESTRDKLENMKESLKNTNDLYIRNKGIYESKLQELKTNFGFNSIKEAQEDLIRRRKKITVMNKRLEESITDFEHKYQGLLS